MSEWGNPGDECRLSASESIGREKPTQGSETSQYLQEQKSTEIPLVVASEKGRAQTTVMSSPCALSLWRCRVSSDGDTALSASQKLGS
jgi:hypothetical protein